MQLLSTYSQHLRQTTSITVMTMTTDAAALYILSTLETDHKYHGNDNDHRRSCSTYSQHLRQTTSITVMTMTTDAAALYILPILSAAYKTYQDQQQKASVMNRKFDMVKLDLLWTVITQRDCELQSTE